MLMQDIITTGSQRITTPQGFLLVPATFSRTGIHDYRAGQVGFTDRAPDVPVKIYRPPEEVFDSVSMASFGRIPITNEHPSGPGVVTLDNMDELSKGMTDPEVTQDGDLMQGQLLITNRQAIADVKSGKSQLSGGYHCEIVIGPGTTPGGDHFDATQRKIRGNHIAIVKSGRGGSRVAIADKGETTVKIKIADVEYEVDQAVADALTAANEETKTALALADEAEEKASKKKKMSGHEEDEEDEDDLKKPDGPGDPGVKKDTAMATKLAQAEAQRDAALEKIPTLDQIDARVDARTKVIAHAERLVADIVTESQSNEQIRRTVVLKLCDSVDKDKGDAYMEARFDALCDGGGESTRFAERNLRVIRDAPSEDKAVLARDKSNSERENAWKGEEAKA